MKYLYWAVAAVVIMVGVGLSVYWGQETVSLPKIVFNYYRNPGQFAETIHVQMKPELKSSPLLMLGVMPGRKIDLEIWKSFLDQTSSELKYQVVIVDPDLPFIKELFPNAIKMDLKKDIARFIAGAKNAQAQGLRMAVLVPSIYASQLLQSNPAENIKKNSDLQPISFSIIGFPRSPEQEANMEIPCAMGQNDRDGEGALGCAVQKKARLLYRKKSKPGFYEGVLDQVGDKDYLVLFNAP
ncbi:MAG TPA: hypothetical protein VIG33_09495 [Pseudobdellovibrionaceae bacterium]|jgi:hypothetical protein